MGTTNEVVVIILSVCFVLAQIGKVFLVRYANSLKKAYTSPIKVANGIPTDSMSLPIPSAINGIKPSKTTNLRNNPSTRIITRAMSNKVLLPIANSIRGVIRRCQSQQRSTFGFVELAELMEFIELTFNPDQLNRRNKLNKRWRGEGD